MASFSCTASVVSSTSDEVIPLCRWRAGSPPFSSTKVRKAMTSCFVTFSISSMRATSARGELEAVEGPAERGQVLGRDLAELHHGLGGGELDVEPDAEAPLRRPDAGHLGTRVARDHPTLRGRLAAGFSFPAYRPVEPNPPPPRSLPGNSATSWSTARVTGRQHQLGDALAAGEPHPLLPPVHQDDAHLAPVVAVDGARGVRDAQAVLEGQAGARADLPLQSRRDGHGDAGGDEPALARGEVDRLVGAQVHAGGAGGLVARQLERLAAAAHPKHRDGDRGAGRGHRSPP